MSEEKVYCPLPMEEVRLILQCDHPHCKKRGNIVRADMNALSDDPTLSLLCEGSDRDGRDISHYLEIVGIDISSDAVKDLQGINTIPESVERQIQTFGFMAATRVMISKEGDAIPPSEFDPEKHEPCDIIFVRKDGWSIAVPEKFRVEAYRLWWKEWGWYCYLDSPFLEEIQEYLNDIIDEIGEEFYRE